MNSPTAESAASQQASQSASQPVSQSARSVEEGKHQESLDGKGLNGIEGRLWQFKALIVTCGLNVILLESIKVIHVVMNQLPS